MAWEYRGNRQYYYRKKRHAEGVSSEYVGRDSAAQLAWQLDCQYREEIHRAKSLAQAQYLQLKQLDPEIDFLTVLVSALIRAIFLTAGYHPYKGQWRKKRMPNNSIAIASNLEKVKRAFQNIKREHADELLEILKRAYQPNPAKEDILALQEWLDEHPDVWAFVFDISAVVEKNLIDRMVPDQAARMGIEKNVEAIKRELGYQQASAMETMLIDSILISWLRCQWIEYRLLLYMGHDEGHSSVTLFWEKRLSAAQRRYLRACEALARIRKFAQKNPLLQVNIAAEGGQQVNVAGDIVKE